MMKAMMLLALVSTATANIVLSRTISDLIAGTTGTLTIGPDGTCTGSDMYGSNDCTLNWGSNYTVGYDVNLPKTIDGSCKINIDAKVDGLLPLTVSCAACGEDCSLTIPIIGMTVTIPALPCPLVAAGPVKGSLDLPLPAMSPVPLRATVTGTVTLVDGAGATLGKVAVDGTLSP